MAAPVRGRPRKYASQAESQYRQRKLYIGVDALVRWDQLKSELCAETDREVATFLLDRVSRLFSTSLRSVSFGGSKLATHFQEIAKIWFEYHASDV